MTQQFTRQCHACKTSSSNVIFYRGRWYHDPRGHACDPICNQVEAQLGLDEPSTSSPYIELCWRIANEPEFVDTLSSCNTYTEYEPLEQAIEDLPAEEYDALMDADKEESDKVHAEWFRNYVKEVSAEVFAYEDAKEDVPFIPVPIPVVPEKEDKAEPESDPVEVHRLKEKLKVANRERKQALERVAAMEDKLGVVEELVSSGINPHYYVAPTLTYGSEHIDRTMFAMLSDVHPGKGVTLAQTNGLNAYTPEIAERRIRTFFQNVAILCEPHEHNADAIWLMLGGDMLENRFMHPGEAPSASMSVTEEIIFMTEQVTQGINFLTEELAAPIKVAAVTGNHGRIANHRRTPASLRVEESLEYIMYHNIASRVDVDEFLISPSHSVIVPAGPYSQAMVHGDGFNYGGGVGGLTIPLNKYFTRLQSGLGFDYLCLGHFHCYTPGPNFVVNGSVCGYDAYALSRGFGFEAPTQALWMVHHKYGLTCQNKVYLGE